MPPGCSDPFSEALRAPDLLEKLAANPETRKHMADKGFLGQIEKLQTLAKSFDPDTCSYEKMGEVGQKIARDAHHDPRIMQALMTLQGMGLTVEERDLKKAENVGDMPRREPVQLEHLQLVQDVADPDEAKTKGNDFFKKGDLAAALAHYDRGIQLLRSQDQVPASTLATLLSNAALCLLRLKWPDRAKRHATMAIAAIQQAEDNSFDQSKLFYRRALACEQLQQLGQAVDDMSRALKHAQKNSLSLGEKHRLECELKRLEKLKASDEKHAKRIQNEQSGERVAEVQRMQGTKMSTKENTSAGGTGASAVVDNSYISEQDFTHWTSTRVTEAVKGIKHICQDGGEIEVSGLDESKSKISAAITNKRGARALYYEMDLHCNWKGRAVGGAGELDGLIRVYNIAHDTKFELGGDHNTSYMYMLGWDQRKKDEWVQKLSDEAAELFDLVVAKVDGVLEELRKK